MATVTSIGAADVGAELQRRVSGWVRMLMARDGLNQHRLGVAIGMDQTTVSNRLRGHSRWTVEDLTRLGLTFDIHPGEFWSDPKAFSPGLDAVTSRARRAPRSTRLSTRWYFDSTRPAAAAA